MRILVIEDDVEIAEGVRAILERPQVRRAGSRHNGDDGFEALTHDRFDVAIVDIGLPKRDGFTVARQARAAGVQTPMLMLTARDAVEDRVRGLDAGAGRLPDQTVRGRRAARTSARAAPPQRLAGARPFHRPATSSSIRAPEVLRLTGSR